MILIKSNNNLTSTLTTSKTFKMKGKSSKVSSKLRKLLISLINDLLLISLINDLLRWLRELIFYDFKEIEYRYGFGIEK